MFVGILACVLAWLPSSSAVTANAMYSYDSACNSYDVGSRLSTAHADGRVRDGVSSSRTVVKVALEGSASSKDFGVAAKSADEFVDLVSASRRMNILEGHRCGGEAGNTWFPKGWSNDKIMHGNSDIASDPSLKWVQKGGRAGAEFYRSGAAVRYTVEGVRDGVKMRVVIEPGGEGIITGFPIP